jgi:hypothetical protein
VPGAHFGAHLGAPEAHLGAPGAHLGAHLGAPGAHLGAHGAKCAHAGAHVTATLPPPSPPPSPQKENLVFHHPFTMMISGPTGNYIHISGILSHFSLHIIYFKFGYIPTNIFNIFFYLKYFHVSLKHFVYFLIDFITIGVQNRYSSCFSAKLGKNAEGFFLF